jgi:hypothetical protein
MSEKPISPLRQRMIADMTARCFKEKVQKTYLTGAQPADNCMSTQWLRRYYRGRWR